MSIAIHHGAPGSYKTSGAIQNDLIPAILDGRLICTNIRGFDDEQRVRDNLKNVPESFKLIYINTATEEGRFKMATFFHWLPTDAYIFFDEINTIYPTTYRPSDLNKLDYPDGIDKAHDDKRPSNITEAFEMHRHYNWDMCCTTPHIRKVNSIVRASSEGAYRHKNQALVGLKGYYQEILHSADDDGKSVSNQLQMRQRRVKKNVFKLYSSTTTDKTRDTQAGRNIFLSPQVIGFFLFFFGVGVYVFSQESPIHKTVAEIDPVNHQVNIKPPKIIDNTDTLITSPTVGSNRSVNRP